MNYVDDKKCNTYASKLNIFNSYDGNGIPTIRSSFGIKIRSIVYLDTNYLFCLLIITSVKEDLYIYIYIQQQQN